MFQFSHCELSIYMQQHLTAPACGVYISQLTRYSRACGSYQDFLDRGLLLTRKILNQGFLLIKLNSSLRKYVYWHMILFYEMVEHWYCRSHSHAHCMHWLKVLRSPPWLDWPLWNICVKNDYGYVSLVVSTSRSFPHSWLITGFVTRLPRRVPLEEQELFTLPKHRISPMGISRVRVTRSLVLCVCLVDRFLPFCNFFFSHCVVCSSLIYEF